MAFRPPRQSVIDRRSFQATAARFGARLQDVSVIASDGVVLRAWFARPTADGGDAVILLHGVGDNREGMTGFAELFLSKGYEVLLPDLRAQRRKRRQLSDVWGERGSGRSGLVPLASDTAAPGMHFRHGRVARCRCHLASGKNHSVLRSSRGVALRKFPPDCICSRRANVSYWKLAWTHRPAPSGRTRILVWQAHTKRRPVSGIAAGFCEIHQGAGITNSWAGRRQYPASPVGIDSLAKSRRCGSLGSTKSGSLWCC